MLRITYGYEVKSDNDEMVALVNCAMEELSVASTPGQFLVDIIPMRMSRSSYGPDYSSNCIDLQCAIYLSGFLVPAFSRKPSNGRRICVT